MTTIKPDTIFCDEVDGIMITAFRQADHYFIIQRENLDPNEFHIELNDQKQGCYNGISKIVFQEDRIVFDLNHTGQQSLNTDTIIISDLAQGPEYKAVVSELELIMKSIINQQTI